jgi:hypothetical protein
VSARDPLTSDQRAKIAELIGDAQPATSALLVSFGESVRDRRDHEHPQWEDFYCLNLSSYMGERMAPVLRRLLDAESRAERYRIAWGMARTRAISTGGAADRYAARAREGQEALQHMLFAVIASQLGRKAALDEAAELRAKVTELESARLAPDAEQGLYTSLRDQLGEALIAAAAVPHTMPVEVFGQAGVLADAVLPVAQRAAETAARTAIEQAAGLFEQRGRALLDGGLTDCTEVAALLRQFAALPPVTAAAVTQLGALPVPGPSGAGDEEDLRARIAGLEAIVAAATEYRVWNPNGMGLYVRRAVGFNAFGVLQARTHAEGRRAWTREGWQLTALLSNEELFCWPDAATAVAEAQRLVAVGLQPKPSRQDAVVDGSEG